MSFLIKTGSEWAFSSSYLKVFINTDVPCFDYFDFIYQPYPSRLLIVQWNLDTFFNGIKVSEVLLLPKLHSFMPLDSKRTSFSNRDDSLEIFLLMYTGRILIEGGSGSKGWQG